MKEAEPKEVRVTWEIVPREGAHWIGKCDELFLSIQAKTREELIVDIIEVPQVMFSDLSNKGHLKRFLRERGLSRVAPESTHFILPVSIPRSEEFHDRPEPVLTQFVRSAKLKPTANVP